MSYRTARADVLEAYRNLPQQSNASGVQFSQDVIACGDESLLAISRALGQDLGRPVMTVNVGSGWLETATRPSSVLLFSRRRGFSADLVREWVASSLQHDVPLGFVLAEDPEDAEFQAAKIVLAHTRIVEDDDAVVDAVNGFCGKPDGLEVARPERLNLVLASRWRLLAIGGHSDLGHVSLGSHVICGAAGPEMVGGQLLVDGCDPAASRCRRRLGHQHTAVPAVSLRAAVLTLMGCNSFDLTAGGYPSTNSLCASALSGQPVAVIGTLGNLSTGFDAVGQFASFVAKGLSLGAAVQRLNRSHQIPTGYGIALAGDPTLRFPPRPPTETTAKQLRIAVDCRDRAQELLDKCYDVIARTRSADRLQRALLRVGEMSLEPGLEEALNTLARRCEQVQEAAWAGIRQLYEAIKDMMQLEPDRIMARLDRAVGRWDEAFIAAAALFNGGDMYSALHAFHRLDSATAHGSCDRCGSRIQVFSYSDPELTGRSRLARECWLCGPISETTDTGPRLKIIVNGLHTPGAVIQPRLSVQTLTDVPDKPGRLAVVVNDRPSDKVLVTHQAAGRLGELADISMMIPAPTRSDLHVLWAAWVSELTVTFAATRLAITRIG